MLIGVRLLLQILAKVDLPDILKLAATSRTMRKTVDRALHGPASAACLRTLLIRNQGTSPGTETLRQPAPVESFASSNFSGPKQEHYACLIGDVACRSTTALFGQEWTDKVQTF